MKQLLQTSGVDVIVALDVHAYFVRVAGFSKPIVYELLAKGGDSNVIETNGKEVKAGGYHRTAKADVAADINTVEAVAIQKTLDEKAILCAVSRHNKTLSLYSIPTRGSNEGGRELSQATEQICPIAVHVTGKRACSLAFARIPGGSKENKEGPDASESSIDIILAADLAGDATAFPLVPAASDDAPLNESSSLNFRSRLLLGHTASMLTGIKIVSDRAGRMKILTSDRDEKVRVSSFPRSYIVEGYLLGHTAFVSSIDVSTDGNCTCCVTSSGDGTVRVWDYISCRELAVIEPLMKVSKKKRDAENDKGSADTKKDNAESCSMFVPIAVALSPDGITVAVVRDGRNTVDFYVLSKGASSILPQKVHSIDCAAQPLAVAFQSNRELIILTKEPIFLLQCQVKHCQASTDGPWNLVESAAVCLTLRKVGLADNVTMPSTVLETDESGQLKMTKIKEKPGWADQEPWNNSERIQRAKNRNQRRKKRKQSEFAGHAEDTSACE